MRTVLSVAYPFAPVSPDAAGGAEQVLRMIDNALVRVGWRSIVIAQEGSQVAGVLVPLPRFAHIAGRERSIAYPLVRGAIDHVLSRVDVDIVHMHGVDFTHYLPDPGVPVLATLHLPPEWYPSSAFEPPRPRIFLNAVSQSQYEKCPRSPALLGIVGNGVDIENRAFSARGDFALALGRICPEKGFHLAIEAAIGAGCEFVLAGRVFPYEEHERYFSTQILPRLDAKRRFIGPAGRTLKRMLLSSARCVLIPSLAAETSSLVAMEALRCGAPAIAFGSGALPEIVTHGVTGFLVSDAGEMAEAIPRTDGIDRSRCRDEAARRFTADRMTSDYMRLYEDIIAGRINRRADSTTENRDNRA